MVLADLGRHVWLLGRTPLDRLEQVSSRVPVPSAISYEDYEVIVQPTKIVTSRSHSGTYKHARVFQADGNHETEQGKVGLVTVSTQLYKST